MKLSLLIKHSYSIPNGHKLRKACYSYMQYTNQVKRAAEVGVALDAIKSLDQYTFSGQIIEEEIRVTIESLNNKGPEIFKKVQNMLDMSQQHGGEALLRPEDISNLSNSKLDPLDISKFNLNLDQMNIKQEGTVYLNLEDVRNIANSPRLNPLDITKFGIKLEQIAIKDPLEKEVQQVIDTKAPFLSVLTKAYPWILGLLVVVLIVYLYTRNKKVIDNFILTIFQKIRNTGNLLLKAIVKGYRWLMPIISNLVFVKSKEIWKEYSPTLKEYGSKGLDIAKKYIDSAIDKAIWLKNKYEYGDSTANYLLLLRKDDREKQKILNNIKLSLRSKRTAKQNLIRTAFEIDYKLGNYLLKTI